jgi:hypothetical protein
VTAIAQIPGQQYSLADMRGVKVLIFTTETELKRINLDADVLQTDIELRLRKAGVPILPGKEWPQGYQKAVVVLTILTVKNDDALAAVIMLQLWRDTGREGSPQLVVTWESVGVGMFGSEAVRRNIRDAVADDADKFANDYLAANPKTRP